MLAPCMLWSCVRPSVCLSVTNRSSVATAERGIKQTIPCDSSVNRVFEAKELGEIPIEPPQQGRQVTLGRAGNVCEFRNNSLYLENVTRQTYGSMKDK